jgi:hypothetical protein
MKKILRNEKGKRKKMENYLKRLKINYHFLNINENESYSKHECDLCTSYGFLSYLTCINCNSKLCLNHKKACNCKVPLIELFYRNISSLEDLIKTANIKNNKVKGKK